METLGWLAVWLVGRRARADAGVALSARAGAEMTREAVCLQSGRHGAATLAFYVKDLC